MCAMPHIWQSQTVMDRTITSAAPHSPRSTLHIIITNVDGKARASIAENVEIKCSEIIINSQPEYCAVCIPKQMNVRTLWLTVIFAYKHFYIQDRMLFVRLFYLMGGWWIRAHFSPHHQMPRTMNSEHKRVKFLIQSKGSQVPLSSLQWQSAPIVLCPKKSERKVPINCMWYVNVKCMPRNTTHKQLHTVIH